MGVVGAILVTSYFGSSEASRLERSAGQLAGMLHRARMQAMSENAEVTVDFSAGSNECTVTKLLSGGGGTVLWVEPISVEPEITFVTPSGTGTFDPRGTFSADDNFWKVTFCATGGSRYVYVFPGGQVMTSDDGSVMGM
jgi:hypothetical protein